jgi:L-iditol 2-dehydrogenase
MKAAFLTDIGRLEIRDLPMPRLSQDGQVLLRVDVVGVCGSDMHYFRSGRIGSQVVKFPWLMGHEFAATVVEVGAVGAPGSEAHVGSHRCAGVPSDPYGLRLWHPLKVGDRVAVDPLVWCGRCDQCLCGRVHTCRDQVFMGCPGQVEGCLTEYVAWPAKCCYKLPPAVDQVWGAMVEPLSIGMWAQRLAPPLAGKKAAILGVGPIGLCTLMAMKAACGDCEIFATDLLEYRLELAKRLGADWTELAEAQDMRAQIPHSRDLRTHGTRSSAPREFDVVFECAGKQETLDRGVEILKPGGTLVAVGIPEGNRISFDMNLVRRKELRIQNVRRQNECVSDAIELAAGGRINLGSMVTHHFSLDQTQQAYELVAGYGDGVVKAVIEVAEAKY